MYSSFYCPCKESDDSSPDKFSLVVIDTVGVDTADIDTRMITFFNRFGSLLYLIAEFHVGIFVLFVSLTKCAQVGITTLQFGQVGPYYVRQFTEIEISS